MAGNNAPLMQIGGLPKGATSEVAEAIVRVATCSPVPDVAIKALEALGRLGQTQGVTVQNCTLSANSNPGDQPGKHCGPRLDDY